MTTIQDIRAKIDAQHPGAYDDMSDFDLAKSIHAKFYPDKPLADFLVKVGAQPQATQAEDVARSGLAGAGGALQALPGIPGSIAQGLTEAAYWGGQKLGLMTPEQVEADRAAT